MSDTPKTDAACFAVVSNDPQSVVVWADFARQLERENAALKEELAPLRETVGVRGDAVTSRDDIAYWCKLMDRAGKADRLERENAALRKLLDTHILRSDLFSYLAWLEDHRDHGDFELEGSKYLVLASDGTTCWGTTFMEAVQIAEQHDRRLFDAARAKEAKP